MVKDCGTVHTQGNVAQRDSEHTHTVSSLDTHTPVPASLPPNPPGHYPILSSLPQVADKILLSNPEGYQTESSTSPHTF